MRLNQHGGSRKGHKLKVKVTLRPTVSRPVCLDVRRPSGTRDQFFFLLEIFFRQLGVCYFVASSLTRGRVCNLPLLLVLLLGSESRGIRSNILLSQFLRLPQPGGPGPRIYIPQEQGVPFLSPLTTRRDHTVNRFHVHLQFLFKLVTEYTNSAHQCEH
jgi:hypothetical protein